MKISILGGNGFVGRKLVQKLSEQNDAILNVLDFSFDNKEDVNSPLNFFKVDFKNTDQVIECVKGSDVVFHLISSSNPFFSVQNPLHDFENDLSPLVNFLNKIKNSNVKKIIFLSSGGTVYGNSNKLPFDENSQTNPVNPYGISKLISEKYIDYFCRKQSIDFIIIRPSNLYGPGQNYNKYQGILIHLLRNHLIEKTSTIFGDGSSKRDYLFIDDLISALVSFVGYDGKYNLFNISSGLGISINELINHIYRTLDIKLMLNFVDSREFDVTSNILSNKLISHELNWRPCFDIEKGIHLTYLWLKENNDV
jgi:UDP-glucose 4-epimerase